MHKIDLARPLQTATHWGAYLPVVNDGKLVEMRGVDFDPDPSRISDGWIDAFDHPARIRQPSIRRGFYENGLNSDTSGRGREPFVSVSWEQAETIVSDALQRIKTDHGNEAIYAGSYGWASAGKFHHAPSQLHRFLNCFGGFTYSVNSYSFASAEVIVPHVMGNFFIMLVNATAWPSIIENTELFVAFGGLPLKNTQVEFGGHARHVQKNYTMQAAESGVKFVSISPIRDDTRTDLNADWLPIIPNTDVALMLGIAHTLFENNLHDLDFLNRYCVGYERFEAYLKGETDNQPKTAEWASSVCGISADAIRSLAVQMSSSRTLLTASWSLTRQEHGEQNYWMAITLAAMLGQIGLPGGGVGFGYSSTNGVGNHVGRLRWQNLPVGRNPLSMKSFIPVARISDMLHSPGKQFNYNGGTYNYPNIELIYWAGGNPFHHHQDLNRLIQGWRKPKCTIIHDFFWTAAARYSDIVLPASTILERNDVSSSPRDCYAIYMDKILPNFAESRTDYEIFSAVAGKLGFESEFTEGRSESEWIQLMFEQTKARSESEGTEFPEYDDFVRNGKLCVDAPPNPGILLQPFREDPQRNPLRTPSGKIEIFSETIDSYNYDDCPGHPTWMPPSEWLGKVGVDSDMLHMISNQPAPRLHSQLDHGAFSQGHKLNRREPLRINPDDAKMRKIKDGDTVRVHNDRGEFLATAKLDDNLKTGVIQIATGAWLNPENPNADRLVCKHGNPNMVTHDRPTSSLAQGPAAMSCLTRVEKYDGAPPEVSAYEPPVIDNDAAD